MAAQLYYSPFIPAFSPNGLPVPGAKLFFFYSATDTLAPIYTSESLGVRANNPVVADLAARFDNVYLDQSIVYRVRLVDANGIQLGDDIDPYIPGAALRGDPGPAGAPDNTYNTLAAFKGSDTGKLVASLAGVAGIPNGRYNWVVGDFSSTPSDSLDRIVIKSDSFPLSQGAWVKDLVAITPEQLGASGDGVTDDTDALQRTLASTTSVTLPSGKTYLVKSKLIANKKNQTITGGGTIKIASNFSFAADTDTGGSHMRAIFVQEENIAFVGISFDATGAPMGTAVENGFIWSTHPGTQVKSCKFLGLGKGTCVWGLAGAPFMAFNDNYVLGCSGAVFTKGRNCVHNDNIIINATDAAIAINGQSSIGSIVQGNTIHNQAMAVIPSMIAVEESATAWVISGNALRGVNGGGIIATNVLDSTVAKGGVIADNVIDARNISGSLGTSPNPAALLSVSPFYTDCIVHDNEIIGVPLGNSNSRAVIIPASGTIFHDNIIDASMNTVASALVNISASTGGLTINNNITRSAAGIRHFLFTDGSYGSVPVSFSGGKFYGGSEAINAELRIATITNLRLYINDLEDVTSSAVINAGTLLGDRAGFLNAGAVSYPHDIGIRTQMRCTTTPSNAGQMPYQNGDLFFYIDPVTNGAIAVARVAGGNPWIKYGAAV